MMPEPYYRDELVELYNADAYDLLPEIHRPCTERVVVLTDPPYSINLKSAGTDTKLEWWADLMNTGRAFSPLMKELRRLVGVEGWVWWFSNHHGLPMVFRAASLSDLRPLECLTWWKGSGQLGYGCSRETELIVLLRGRPSPIAQKNIVRGLMKHPRARETEHPAEKPTSLLQQLLAGGDEPVDLVVDPFAGSGSTLVAAKALGLRSIGIEQSEDWCRVAAGRLKQANLFAGAE